MTLKFSIFSPYFSIVKKWKELESFLNISSSASLSFDSFLNGIGQDFHQFKFHWYTCTQIENIPLPIFKTMLSQFSLNSPEFPPLAGLYNWEKTKYLNFNRFMKSNFAEDYCQLVSLIRGKKGDFSSLWSSFSTLNQGLIGVDHRMGTVMGAVKH